MIRKIYDSLLALAYPQPCQICRKSVETTIDGTACRACWRATHVFAPDEILCAKCGAPLQNSVRRTNPDSSSAALTPTLITTFCRRPSCGAHFYDAARAAGIYEKALAAVVLNLKREPFLPAALRAHLLAAFENARFPEIDFIAPVPLSKKRLIERGFNQAETIAAFLSRKTFIEMDAKTLVRRLHTPIHRAAMDEKRRAATVADAFAVTRPKFVENKKILLIDDVFTSGATVSACAEILKQNGADKVFVLTIARAF